jgi:drug/metabolite transporter (DMT)-like permease
MWYAISFALIFAGLTCINIIFSYQSKHIDPQFWSTFKFQLLMLPFFFAANLSIGYGVKFGMKVVNQLGILLIIAKCIEVLISIGMGYWFMKEVPSWKTWIGLAIIGVGVVLVRQK